MEIIAYTDGSCIKNPGKGGYAGVLICKEKNIYKEIYQGYRLTTNNRMELLAVINTLKCIKTNKNKIILITDSMYLVNAINKNWISRWEKTNFKNIKNIDLWKTLIALYKFYNFNIIWTKGHSNNKWNNYVDELAFKAANMNNLIIDEVYERSL